MTLAGPICPPCNGGALRDRFLTTGGYNVFIKRAGLIGLGLAAVMAGRAMAQAPTVTVGGVAYAQFVYQLKDTANHVNNFDITRAYINVTGKFAYGIGSRVTGDIFRTADGSLSYRLKYAYATWNPEKSALTYKIGQMHTPWLDWEEHLWDYRVQGQMAMERAGYLSSSDFGFTYIPAKSFTSCFILPSMPTC